MPASLHMSVSREIARTSYLLLLQVAPSVVNPDPRKELEIRANGLSLSPPIYKMYSKKEKHSAKITIYASVKVNTSLNCIYMCDHILLEDVVFYINQ